MPITIKSTELKYKNPTTGQYQGIDAVAETTTSEQCALIEAKGVETRASIPSDYTTLSDAVNNLMLESTNDSTDRTSAIITMLTNNKKCILGAGTFYTTGIDMPDGSTLIGMGDATVLHKTGSGSYVINMNKDNAVDGICIDGNDTVSSTIGEHHGILWNGDYSTSQDSSLQPKNGKLSNLTIKNCNGGGITCNNTGYGRDNNILAVNIAITNCNVGINIPFVSEYHKFTNVDALECYYGCINNGGNNSFIGCDFSNSKTAAFVIDNSNEDKTNNSHGSAVACFFNHVAHSGGNLQDGLYLNKVSHGFIFSGCQFFDCALEIIGCNGVEITDSIFGSSIPITIDGGKGTVFAENSFQNPPTISITNNALAYFRNCIRRDNGYYIAETGQGILTANTEWNFPVVSGYKSGDNIYLYIPTTAETGTTHNIAVSNVTGTLLGSDGSTLANNENLTSACQYLQLYSVGRGMVMRLYKSGGWGNAQDIVMVCGVVKITASVPIK